MRDRVYVLGDSISMHYGPYLEAYLRGVMDYARKGGEEAAVREPPQSPVCHSERSEESHRSNYLHIRDSSPAYGGLRMTLLTTF